MNITCSTSLLMAYSRNSDMSLPRLSYKRLQFRLGYVLSLGWFALEKVCCRYTCTHGSLCRGPRGKILKILANSQLGTLAWQQPHEWDWKQIFPVLPNLQMGLQSYPQLVYSLIRHLGQNQPAQLLPGSWPTETARE